MKNTFSTAVDFTKNLQTLTTKKVLLINKNTQSHFVNQLAKNLMPNTDNLQDIKSQMSKALIK